MTETDPKSLAVYSGRTLSYYEMHRDMSLDEAGQVDIDSDGHEKAGCQCPLAPHCRPPPDTSADKMWQLLQRARMCLLDDDETTWKLSLEQRQNIQFKVLVEQVPEPDD